MRKSGTLCKNTVRNNTVWKNTLAVDEDDEDDEDGL